MTRPRPFLWIVLSAVLMLSVSPSMYVAQAYSDATQEIHRYAECTADGFCRPEFYVSLDDPLINGTMRIDYLPAVDPHFWKINVTGLANVTVDAELNFATRGCSTYFVDCPDTDYLAWLINPNQCVLVVDLSTDVPFYFRMVNVPQPEQVTLDGSAANITRYADGLSVDVFPVGTHQLVFTNPACNPCAELPDPGLLMIAIILVVLWIAFAAIGVVVRGGLYVMFAGLMGIILAILYLVPCAAFPIWLVILGLAIMTLLAGIGLAFSKEGEA
jgi:hypothetical protein